MLIKARLCLNFHAMLVKSREMQATHDFAYLCKLLLSQNGPREGFRAPESCSRSSAVQVILETRTALKREADLSSQVRGRDATPFERTCSRVGGVQVLKEIYNMTGVR